MKHARADANYAILTKRVKLQHEKKPVINLISMQSVGFEQTFMKFTEIMILQESCHNALCEIYKGREMHRHYV